MEPIHGGDLLSQQRAYPGVPLLDFSANINPLGLPEGVGRALERCAADCVHYPDPFCRELTAALSAFEEVEESWILCGGGAAELIYRMAFGLRPCTALVLSPTFAEYRLALEAAGCTVRSHPLQEADGFVVDSGLLDSIHDLELVVLCNPNNPTGSLIEPDLLEQILRRCEQIGAVLAVDECFLDFTEGGVSMKRYLAASEGLIILKAFTKLFAMPGLRMGYAFSSSPRLLEALSRAGPPWTVSVPAAACGIAATKETGYLAETHWLINRERPRLAAGLTALGCKVYPAAANFLLFQAPVGLAAQLKREGILVRDCANFEGLRPGFYRTAVRTEQENNALIRKIKERISWETY